MTLLLVELPPKRQIVDLGFPPAVNNKIISGTTIRADYSVNYKNIKLMRWRKFNGEQINLPIKQAVADAIIQETEKRVKLKVCIGTDSQVKGEDTEFATVIVFLREHNGGFMYIHNEKTKTKYHIKERMLVEVAKSIEVAYELCDLFIEHHIEMEVHADINTNPQFKSNDALREAMGYILGMGFAFKAKPEAFASSSCADKICN
jgi:predicted RNase H-related nuclease YkuK (DUF458 family)